MEDFLRILFMRRKAIASSPSIFIVTKSIFGNLKLEATRAKVYKGLNSKLIDKNIPILE